MLRPWQARRLDYGYFGGPCWVFTSGHDAIGGNVAYVYAFDDGRAYFATYRVMWFIDEIMDKKLKRPPTPYKGYEEIATAEMTPEEIRDFRTSIEGRILQWPSNPSSFP